MAKILRHYFFEPYLHNDEERGTNSRQASARAHVPEIQLLRAAAVTAVLLFHMGLPVGSGFWGVDVFFFVSGFVVCRSLMREWVRSGTVSLKKFYSRRLARLLPALALTVSVTALLSLLIYPTAKQFLPTALTGFASLFGAGNVATQYLSWDYFGPLAKENALLHLWSLGVEEQFYLVFPVMFLLLIKLASSRNALSSRTFVILSVLVTVAGASFTVYFFSEWLKQSVPLGVAFFGFYSPIPRAWEFLLGAAVAVAQLRFPGFYLRTFLSSLGWLLLLYGFFLPNTQTEDFSIKVLIPIAGAALVLLARGSGRAFRSRFFRSLSGLGTISYSLYLWHWPLIVAANQLFPGNLWVRLGAGLLALVLSMGTFRFFEEPLRRWGSRTVAPGYQLGGLSVLGAIASCAVAVTLFLQVVSPLVEKSALRGELGHAALEAEIEAVSFPCVGIPSCFQSTKGGDIDVLLLGRSHASHLYIGLSELYPGVTVAHIQSSDSAYKDLPGHEEMLESVISQKKIGVVVIGEPWLRPDYEIDWRFFSESVYEIGGSGKKVFVVDGIPVSNVPISWCKYSPLAGFLPRNCSFPSADNDVRHRTTASQLSELARNNNAVTVIDSFRQFCGNSVCVVGDEGDLWYYDADHLGLLGSRHVAQAFPNLGLSGAENFR
jgi:peptidoglycan/LPS O-acetylase OafA/YrhL